ncbi:MAG: ATP-binding protein [ANME-2 cluster archaeon]|nr:ATP-binding protein [ANME-2 cluster archaeon]
MKVLVVDDKKNDRKMLSKLLVSNSYEPVEASNGIEALEAVDKSKPDLIISDIMMPEMDGFTLLRELNKVETAKDIPFVFYTAHYIGIKDKELATSLGASRFIIKPVEPKELLSEIQEVIEEYKAGLIKSVEPFTDTDEDYLSQYSERLFHKLEDKYHELELTKNFLDTVLEDMVGGVMVMDPGLKVIYCNKRMQKIMSCDHSSGKMPPDAQHTPCIPDMAYASHEPFEIELVNKKDDKVHLEGIISPAIEESGALTAHIGVFRDITEQNRIQAEINKRNWEIATLYELNRMLCECSNSDELIENAFDRIIKIMDVESACFYLVKEGNEKVDVQLCKGQPQKFFDLIIQHLPDNVSIQEAIKAETPVIFSPLSARIPDITESDHELIGSRIITLQLRSTGKVIGLIDMMVSPYREMDSDEVSLLEKMGVQVGMALENLLIYEALQAEVAEHEQSEKELKKYRDSLEDLVEERSIQLQIASKELHEANISLQELDKLKTMFLASMSHEVRTPLTSIIGFTDIILKGMSGDITDEQRNQLTMVFNSGQHLLGLINDLLDVSKIEAGKIGLNPESFLLDEDVSEVCGSLEKMATDKGLKFSVNVQPDVLLFHDKQRFNQILINLIGNAIKFTNKGSIDISGKQIGDDIHISVKDTGIGIREEDMPRLFKPFAKIHMNTDQTTEGTGLGLYLCKKLVDMMDGEIWAESEFKKGSEFTFKIPVHRVSGGNE